MAFFCPAKKSKTEKVKIIYILLWLSFYLILFHAAHSTNKNYRYFLFLMKFEF